MTPCLGGAVIDLVHRPGKGEAHQDGAGSPWAVLGRLPCPGLDGEVDTGRPRPTSPPGRQVIWSRFSYRFAFFSLFPPLLLRGKAPVPFQP